jgi:hypothetical protein
VTAFERDDPAVDSIVRRIPVPIKRGREGASRLLMGADSDNVTDSTSERGPD